MKSQKILQGIIKRHPDGFGFFIADATTEHVDVFIPANSMKTAMTNDKVTITVEKENDGRFRGEIIRITERAQKRIAGKFSKLNESFGAIKDEGKGWGSDLKIAAGLSMNAKNGELVAAMIKTYPDTGDFTGEIVEVIGDAESAMNDIRRVIVNQNIPDVFTDATIAEAATFGKNPVDKDFIGRTDLRHLPIVTIDGATAKDFDDAVYVEMKQNGSKILDYTASSGESYSIGLEVGIKPLIIIPLKIGAEAGITQFKFKDAKDSLGSAPKDIDLSGNYIKVFLGLDL